MGATGRPETRSKYDDGLIGWRKLPVRSQDTLWEWDYDNGDTLQGMVQMAPPFFKRVTIPIEKALLFKTRSRKANPEGRSLLRNAYQDWYFKRRVREIEGIGIERDLAGYPFIQPPEDVELFDENGNPTDQFVYAERVVQKIRRDESEGLVLPAGWKFELVSSGGKRQIDTNAVIQRYDRNIAMTFLADFILLGHEKVGSFALSSDKTQLFGVAMGTFLKIICEVFNSQAIPRLIQMNGDKFKGITAYPELINGEIETRDLGVLGEFLKHTVLSGLITPDENLEDHLRMVAELPERDPATSYGNINRDPDAEFTRTGGLSATVPPPVTIESEPPKGE